jgi:hypothetical protein
MGVLGLNPIFLFCEPDSIEIQLNVWVFQIPPWRDSTRNDWDTSRPAFTAYGGKIQATRFAGGRYLRKYIYDPMSCKDPCGGMNLIFNINRLKTFLTSFLLFRIAGFRLRDR